MRIGIIAVGRSGGYNLGEWLGYETRSKFIHEPYKNGFDTNGKNIVVKWLYTEWLGIQNPPQMDKWIGLWREDIRECAISHLKAEQSGNWRKGYQIDSEWINKMDGMIDITQKWINKSTTELKGLPQIELMISYEGIYNRGDDIQKLTDYLGIRAPKYQWMLHPSLRLRNMGERTKKQLI